MFLRLTVTLGLLLGAMALPSAQAQHQHAQPPAAQAGMAEKCKAMMAEHQKMMDGMKAADARLEQLVARVKASSGQAKADATSDAVVEIVAQRRTMHEAMMKMHQGTMGHMMEHMQAGAASMAMCPMMKGHGGKP